MLPVAVPMRTVEDAYESVGFLSGKRLLASMVRSCGAHSRSPQEGGVRVARQLQAAFLAQWRATLPPATPPALSLDAPALEIFSQAIPNR